MAPIALTALLVVQGACTALLAARLAPGRRRPAPVAAALEPGGGPAPGSVTIVVPTFNEAARVAPLLAALAAEGPVVAEILVVDSRSTDGTPDLVERARRADPRIRLVTDPPTPPGWIGKAWALHHAATLVTTEWMLSLDADVRPRAPLAAAIVARAEREGVDALSLAPRFAGQRPLERLLQPALLMTLIYRTGAPRSAGDAGRMLANGQCFLVRRATLTAHGGYEPVRASFAEDVSLMRYLARCGAKVAFLDGSRLYDVHSYESAAQMWREWGRSIDLKDATSAPRQAADVAFVYFAQALPIPALLAGMLGAFPPGPLAAALLGLNAALLAIRVALTAAIAASYKDRGAAFWLSPLADSLAWIRLVLSSIARPTHWRGRKY